MVSSRQTGLVALVLLTAVALSSPLAAQTVNATLSGTVYDAQNAVLPGATVTATHVATAKKSIAVTDSDGRYRIIALVPGDYELAAELDGFARFMREGIILRIAQELAVNVTLQLAGLSEAVTVTAQVEGVDTTSANIAPAISRSELDTLPVAGRDFASLAALVPGVASVGSGGVSSSGMAANKTAYLLDGVNNTAPNLGNQRGSVTLEAVQEFQVIANQFAAEYGQASGAVVSAITRGGSNRNQGRVFGFFSNDNLNSDNPFADPALAAPFSRTRYGGFWGGPLHSDNLFYFASYEGTRERTTNIVLSPLAEPDELQSPRTDDEYKPFARVDWNISAKQTLWVKYRMDKAVAKGQGIGGTSTFSRGTNRYETNQDLTVSHTYIPKSNLLNELRFSGGYRHLVTDAIGYAPAAPGYDFDTPAGFTISRPSGNLGPTANTNFNTQAPTYIFTDNVTIFTRAHNIKLGAEVQLYRGGLGSPTNPVGTYTFNTDAPFNPSVLSTYPSQFTRTIQPDFPKAYIALPDNKYVLFAQDSWRLGQGLTVNYGIRLDKDEAWKRITLQDVATNWNISPRFGAAWDATGDGRTVVRGGYGHYYDQLLLNPALGVARNMYWEYISIQRPGYPDPYTRPGGIGVSAPPTNSVVSQDLKTPYTRSGTVGFERMLPGQIQISVDGVYTRGFDQYYRVDLNAPINGVRPNPDYGYNREYRSGAESWYKALLVGLKRRQGRLQWGASYTLASSENQSDTWNDTPQDGNNIEGEKGPQSGHRRHQFVGSLTAQLPWGFQTSAILQYRSGLPYNITTGLDNNRDSNRNDRPDLVDPGGDPTDKATFYRGFVNRVGDLSRNYGLGPDFLQVDFRVSKHFRTNPVDIEVLVEAFNLFNRENLGSPNGNLGSSVFGQSTGIAGDPREIQVGFRLNFPGR